METTEFITKMLLTPPVQFAEVYEQELQTGIANDIESSIRQIERAAEHLTVLAAYLEGRFTVGLSHDSAVKKAMRVRRSLRKAQGYNVTHDFSF